MDFKIAVVPKPIPTQEDVRLCDRCGRDIGEYASETVQSIIGELHFHWSRCWKAFKAQTRADSGLWSEKDLEDNAYKVATQRNSSGGIVGSKVS